MSSTETEGRQALTAGLVCYFLWGLLPLFFHLLARLGVGAFEIMAHRTLWAVIWAAVLVLIAGQRQAVGAALRNPRMMGVLVLSTLAIFANWTIYVWAVNDHRVLEASLGYYINPLMNRAVGAALFRERIGWAGLAAIALAAVGVGVQTLALGHLPLISLALAVSFCTYGVIRKQVKVEAQTGLFIECLYLAPLGLLYAVWLESHGQGHFFAGPQEMILLLLTGPITVVPLALFAWAARRLPLTTIGFLQFIAPTLQFLSGLFLGETFTPLRGVSFAFIWAGVAVFAWAAWRKTRAVRAAAAA